MPSLFILLLALVASTALAATVKVDVNSMPRVLFTGDSQTCGRVGAWDYPQMLSWEMPVRVINTGVGGTNTTHLLRETSGGTAEVKAGEREVRGTGVGWGSGPYPGQTIRLGTEVYTIDRIETKSYQEHRYSIWITEAARADFSGTDYAIEPGWRARVADWHPDYACFMYTVNDAGKSLEDFTAAIEELLRRCDEIGAQPILLSGFPMMVADRGGTHPGNNLNAVRRAEDLQTIADRQGVPYGDVFRTLLLLDEQSTSVWVDTVHPTSEGSTAALNALRHIMRQLGLAANPYWVRGYRQGAEGLVPITISQPDYSVAGVQDENRFDLEAIHRRDEYGLLAEADGEGVEASPGLHLHFGVGPAERINQLRVEVVVSGANRLKYYDWSMASWTALAQGDGRLSAAIAGDALPRAVHDGELRLWVAGENKVVVDYASVTIEGEVAPFRPQRHEGRIVWPPQDYLAWQGGGLVTNGEVAAGEGLAPTGWEKRGASAVWIRDELVARGTGAFASDKRIDLFRSADVDFAATIRGLDMLTIAAGPEGCTGNFLISRVESDGSLRLRRTAPQEAAGLGFVVRRWSGCGAVPGGCALQCAGDSYWQQVVPLTNPGRYRLGFFYRAYDPAAMAAKGGPGRIAEVRLLLGPTSQLTSSGPLDCSYQWQRAWVEFVLPGAGELCLQAHALGATPVQFTGFSLSAL